MVLSNQLFTLFRVNAQDIQISSSRLNKGKILKILLILGYFLTTYNFLIFYFYQPKGYIIDIYSELPILFFLTLIICYILGSVILFFSQGITRKLGILLLVFTYSTVLIIPYMLGYYSMGRADDMSYIGEYLQISKSGNIARWDIYPASHIIGATLSIGTGLAPHLVSFVIPIIFSLIFVVGLILCCRLCLMDQIYVNIAISSSIIFYLGPYNFLNVPHALFFSIMPIFIYILFKFMKNPNFSNIALIIPFTLLVPLTHPFIVLFVFSTFLAIIVFSRILKRFIDMNYWKTIGPLIITSIAFFSWFIYCSTLLGSFRRIILSFQKEEMEPVFFETTDKLAKTNIDINNLFQLIIVYYGRYIIPFLIITIAVVLLYFRRDRISQALKNCMIFWVFFYIIFVFIELILFFNPIFSHQPDRLTNLNFIVYAQVPLFVLSLYIIFIKPQSTNRKMVLLLLILSITWGLSLFGAFNSPNIFKPNSALSNNEVQGMEWFYQTRVTENVVTPVSQIDRFHDLFADGDGDVRIFVPDHFGYGTDNRSFAEINLEGVEQSYVILLTIDELVYQKVTGYKNVRRYNAEDFRRFRNDNSINKIFDDLNIEIYNQNYI